MATFKELEKEATDALELEEREEKVRILKDKIREIKATKRVLNRMLKQYEALLATDLDDIDAEYFD